MSMPAQRACSIAIDEDCSGADHSTRCARRSGPRPPLTSTGGVPPTWWSGTTCACCTPSAATNPLYRASCTAPRSRATTRPGLLRRQRAERQYPRDDSLSTGPSPPQTPRSPQIVDLPGSGGCMLTRSSRRRWCRRRCRSRRHCRCRRRSRDFRRLRGRAPRESRPGFVRGETMARTRG